MNDMDQQGLDGLSSQEVVEAVVSRLESQGRGRKEVNYRLRDWIFSRQRYWGEVSSLKCLTPRSQDGGNEGKASAFSCLAVVHRVLCRCVLLFLLLFVFCGNSRKELEGEVEVEMEAVRVNCTSVTPSVRPRDPYASLEGLKKRSSHECDDAFV